MPAITTALTEHTENNRVLSVVSMGSVVKRVVSQGLQLRAVCYPAARCGPISS